MREKEKEILAQKLTCHGYWDEEKLYKVMIIEMRDWKKVDFTHLFLAQTRLLSAIILDVSVSFGFCPRNGNKFENHRRVKSAAMAEDVEDINSRTQLGLLNLFKLIRTELETHRRLFFLFSSAFSYECASIWHFNSKRKDSHRLSSWINFRELVLPRNYFKGRSRILRLVKNSSVKRW